MVRVNITNLKTGDATNASYYHTGRYHKGRERRYEHRPFIAWDGEGWTDAGGNHHYCLFGSSATKGVRSDSLRTAECLGELLRAALQHPEAIHIGYAFDYDVNMILGTLRESHIRVLKEKTFVTWGPYRIEHIPRKWFQVTGPCEGKKVTCRVQDIFTFFGTSFVKALKGWGVGTPEEIQAIEDGKEKRGDFSLDRIDSEVYPYWKSELELIVQLAEKLRENLYSAGLKIDQWYGPGVVAHYLYKKNKTEETMDRKLPEAVNNAAAFAYAGGRFETYRAGLYEGPVYTADINSAYPYALSLLPDLSNGNWVHLREGIPAELDKVFPRIGLYRIRFHGNRSAVQGALSGALPMPLFCRDSGFRIHYPYAVEGWYHAPEARMVWNLFRDQCEILEAWEYEDDGSYPFKWVEEMYSERKKYQSKENPENYNPAEKALKLGLNSLYGKLAQRIGWNEKTGEPPKWHQLEWAGAITSMCRSMLYLGMMGPAKDGGLIAAETDGIFSTTPFRRLPNGTGTDLGQWECEEYSGILFMQNGVYWLRDQNGDWKPPKSRGIPQKQLDINAAMLALRDNEPLRAVSHQFIGYGAALHRNPLLWRKWIDTSKEFVFGGNGKRIHDPEVCTACKGGHTMLQGLHPLRTARLSSYLSTAHRLPWKEVLAAEKEEAGEHDRWDIFQG